MTVNKLICLLSTFLLTCSLSAPAQDKWEKAQSDFQSMPAAVRPNPLWFWNNAQVEPDELVGQMAGYRDAGYGGLSILPFGKGFKPKYLTEQYFDVYGLCIEEAAKLGMTLWIYDEYGFPSGTAGDINGDGNGRFRTRFPGHTNKRLDMAQYPVPQGKKIRLTVPSDSLMAVVGFDSISKQRIDLKPFIKNGELRWSPPAGHWKTLIFRCVDAGNTIVDYLSPEAVGHFIEMTHEEYYKRFSRYFGTTIVGTFFDEPTLYYANGRTWTGDFNLKFKAQHGYDPDLLYPALWFDIGPETAEARNLLFGFRSQLYAEGYPRLVSEWSLKHGVHATGHQDNEEIFNCVGTSGDLMKCFKYQEVPGIDKIGGNRPTEGFYKVVSSAATNWDHSLVMSETYGAMGNIDWNTIFGIAMDQYSKGINLLIPHAVWYDTTNITFLPELSLRNPLYADSLRTFNDYLARLNALLQKDSRWIGDVAVLYPIHTMQAGHYFDGPLDYYHGGVEIPGLNYIDIGLTLSDSLGCDFMFVHPETLEEKGSVAHGRLHLNNQMQTTFRTVVVPAGKTISLAGLRLIQDLAAAGGHVVFVGEQPSQSTFLAENAEIQRIVAEMLHHRNVFTVEKASDLCHILPKIYHSVSFIDNNPLRNIHKHYEGRDFWFFCNPDAKTVSSEIEVDGEYSLELWDPHSGQTGIELKTSVSGGKTRFHLTLDAYRSVFVVQRKTDIAAEDLYVRDPFIVVDESTKTYYLHVNECPSVGLWKSADLKTWTRVGHAFTPDSTFWGKNDCWAPDVYEYRGKYYMLVTYSSDVQKRGTAILVADRVEGPFRPLINRPITPNEWTCLDASLYIDENRQPWLVYCHEWIEIKDGEIVAQRLSDDLTALVGPPLTIFRASEAPWAAELSGQPGCYVTDAPVIYRSGNGSLLMTWSSFTKDGKYGIGVARSVNGRIDGKWKHSASTLNNDDGGHSMIFRDISGQMKISYHATNGRPRLTIHNIEDRNGTLRITDK
jgi:hypothetical protein